MWQTNASIVRVWDERGKRFDHTYQYPPKHSTNQVANTSKYRCSKSKETKCETKIENCTAELQAVD